MQSSRSFPCHQPLFCLKMQFNNKQRPRRNRNQDAGRWCPLRRSMAWWSLGWQPLIHWELGWLAWCHIHIILVNGGNSFFVYVHFYIFGEDSEFWGRIFFEMGFKPPIRITLYDIATWTLNDPCFHWTLGLLLQLLKPTNREETGSRFFQTDRTWNYPLGLTSADRTCFL